MHITLHGHKCHVCSKYDNLTATSTNAPMYIRALILFIQTLVLYKSFITYLLTTILWVLVY